MKKYLAVFIAALFVIGMSAFTLHHSSKKKHFDTVLYHFIPNDGSEGAYENTESWEVIDENPGCVGSNDPCVIEVDVMYLSDTSDEEAKIQSLVDFLSDQNGGLGDLAADAVDAVENYFTTSWKP